LDAVVTLLPLLPPLLLLLLLLLLQGFHDEAYKQRRVMIANIAREHEV
jgi:hypothetical protein